jgi:hypothetical protein
MDEERTKGSKAVGDKESLSAEEHLQRFQAMYESAERERLAGLAEPKKTLEKPSSLDKK